MSQERSDSESETSGTPLEREEREGALTPLLSPLEWLIQPLLVQGTQQETNPIESELDPSDLQIEFEQEATAELQSSGFTPGQGGATTPLTTPSKKLSRVNYDSYFLRLLRLFKTKKSP